MSDGGIRQLDEISAKIGELTAYTHEHRHGVNNLSQKFDALALQVSRQISELRAEMSTRLDLEVRLLGGRISKLETDRDERAGAMKLGTSVLRSPVFGWIAALALAAAGLVARQYHL